MIGDDDDAKSRAKLSNGTYGQTAKKCEHLRAKMVFSGRLDTFGQYQILRGPRILPTNNAQIRFLLVFVRILPLTYKYLQFLFPSTDQQSENRFSREET